MSKKKIAIITGANSGLGKEFLKLLNDEKDITEVWAIARNKERLDQLVVKKGSNIVNIASQASFQPLPYQNIYSSTKAFVRNYTRALNVELKDKGINAIAVCPGWMITGLIDRGVIGAEKGTNNFTGMVTPDLVAKKALKDAKKNKDISVYGIYTKSSHLLAKLLPQKMMMQVWLKQQHIKK